MPRPHKISHRRSGHAPAGWNPDRRHALSGKPGGTAALVAILNYVQGTHRAELLREQHTRSREAEMRFARHAKAARAGVRSLRWIGEQDIAETWIRLFGENAAERHAAFVAALAIVGTTATDWMYLNQPPRAARAKAGETRARRMSGEPVTLREALAPVAEANNLSAATLADYVLDVAVVLPADAQRRLLELRDDEPTYQPHERDIAARHRERIRARLRAPSRRKL